MDQKRLNGSDGARIGFRAHFASSAAAAMCLTLPLALVAVLVCGCGDAPPTVPAEPVSAAPQTPAETPAADASPDTPDASAEPVHPLPLESVEEITASEPTASEPTASTGESFGTPEPEPQPGPRDPTTAESSETSAAADAGRPSLDEQLAGLQIPPAWLESVTTSYDTNQPWKDARLEIRRLFSLNRPEAHREGIKLMWIYLQKDDIGDGHEYPMYTFLGGEPLWSVRAHEEYLSKPHENTPIHAYITLASLYIQFNEHARAKACLDKAMAGLPGPPWTVQRKADILAAYGDLYVSWGDPDQAKQYYAQAAALYPTAKPPYGGHLLPRRAAEVQAKLDRLTFRSLQTAALRDGRYRDKALGYAGDIDVTVTIQAGRIADIQLKHEEKIDQNACVIVPQRIKAAQSLEVDGISGATVTKEAIVNGVYRCLKQAGLQ